MDKIRKAEKHVGINLEVPDPIRERARKVTEDLLNKREAFLKARLRPIWQLPGMTKIAAQFITLQIQKNVESHEYRLTFTENLKLICDPPRLEKLFLR
jgi:hypothetical protein